MKEQRPIIRKDVIDKSSWGPGLWQDEPDYESNIDWTTGYEYEIRRNQMGTLCGYVALPPEHPDYGKSPVEIDVDVHGGLTFSETTAGKHWVGFDCAHGGDLIPFMEAMRRRPDWPVLPSMGIVPDEYRTIDYVRREVRSLARQLKRKEHGQELGNVVGGT